MRLVDKKTFFLLGFFPFIFSLQNAPSGIGGTPKGKISVGLNVQVSKALEQLSHGEVYIAADPNNVRRLLGVSMVFSEEMNNTYSVIYASQDGGIHWALTQDTKQFAFSPDPVCAFGPDGTSYFIALSASVRDDGHDLVSFISKDGGLTWSAPTVIPSIDKGADREYVVVDHTGGKYRGRIYINGLGFVKTIGGDHPVSAISVWHSLDKGSSFSEPVKMASWNSRYIYGMGNGVILSDGTFICLFGERRDFWQADGSRNYAVSSPGHSNAVLYVAASEDGGQSLEEPVKVCDWYQPNSVYDKSTQEIPCLATDQSKGPFKDRLYAVWPDERSGRAEILLAHSSDKGKTWSDPIVINDDNPALCPNKEANHLHPQVAVNKDGVVGVMWYDRRDNPEDLGYWVRFTASLDGGETFLPSVRVSEKPMSHGKDERWIVHGFSFPSGGSASKSLSFVLNLDGWHYHSGDTVGMAADAEGLFHPIWIDNRTGIRQVWTAPVIVEGKVLEHGSPELAALADVTDSLELMLTNPRYDRLRDVVSVDLRLKNISDKAVTGPLKMRVLRLRSELGTPEILGASGGQKGPGSIVDFDFVSELLPGEVSPAKTLEFHLSDIQPIRRGKYDFRWNLVSLDARIFGSSGNH